MRKLDELNETQRQAIEAYLQENVLVYHVAFPGEKDCSICTTNLRGMLITILEDMNQRYEGAKPTQKLVMNIFDLTAGSDLEVKVKNGTDDRYYIRCQEITMMQYLAKIPLPEAQKITPRIEELEFQVKTAPIRSMIEMLDNGFYQDSGDVHSFLQNFLTLICESYTEKWQEDLDVIWHEWNENFYSNDGGEYINRIRDVIGMPKPEEEQAK